MADIRPFAGIRPAVEKARAIAALPYDVYNRAEAKEETERNPLSFLKIDRAETQFDDSVGTYEDCVYKKAHDTLWQMVKDGDFIRDTAPAYYIYELTMDGRSQTGIAACASIDDYTSQVIKKHENTRAQKEEDRIRHVDACDAQTGPIFLAYRNQGLLQKIIDAWKENAPTYDFVSDDRIRHRLWIVADERAVAKIRDAFSGIKEIYIADGHHRAASAVKVGLKRRAAAGNYDGTEEFNYFLSVLFPDSELKIMDYNRVVRDLNGYTPGQFLQRISSAFTVSKLLERDGKLSAGDRYAAIRPQKKGEIAMYLNGAWYRLEIKAGYRNNDPIKGLDVSLLQDLLLEPVLGIHDPKTDERIDFVGGIRGYGELEKRVLQDCKVAFGMYPTSIEELFAVADAGLLMPPKSTWFEPKLRSGLLIHKIS
ncbi:MAG: DUF1015 domain-containing protein [Eubacterium sp.]|jgi:Uncharacterized conserved protein|nr:DUF1015 domain-containing protein [Eubacterium sp.]